MIAASFRNIGKKILQCIDESNDSINVSVAWLTSKELLGQLVDKLELGCKVEILISDHFENQKLNYSKFLEKGGKVFVLPSESGKFLHDKFAIFDNKRIIAGSYNWTYSAEYFNHEFVIQSDEENLVKQFRIRFENLKRVVTQYDKQKLISKNNLTADTHEEQFIALEGDLENEFVMTLKEANELKANINAASVISYIQKYGAIGGASRLIGEGPEKLHSGLLKLWEIKRLDISFENIILKDKYRILFSEDILDKAKKRLDQLNYEHGV